MKMNQQKSIVKFKKFTTKKSVEYYISSVKQK